MKVDWDVIIIGGGHAGIEAALAAGRKGCSVILISARRKRIGEMSCNPAIGGIAKGTIVREIDALDGSMAKTADATSLQFRMLNRKKGPAVWGPRVQSDAHQYANTQQQYLDASGISILEDEVTALLGPTEHVEGVKCRKSGDLSGRSVVIAAGTFLKGRLFRGEELWRGGRIGDISADSLEEDLEKRMFHVERFKTGTPARVLRSTVKIEELDVQESDSNDFSFSFERQDLSNGRREEVCYITNSSTRTNEIVKEYLHRSPLMAGRIEGTGPRYCPSFEDKVVKFPDRKTQKIYVEPMGFGSRLLYLNGLSTSLPREAQEKMVRSLHGFDESEIVDYGYAVEYSYFNYGEIDETLRLRRTENVFAAGQICGTSGYEEAAGLGVIAGANAAAVALKQQASGLSRMDSYIGVMIDDIVKKGADEPYRMFSSRAENRLHLRQDNADRRLLSEGLKFGILSDGKRRLLASNCEEADRIKGFIEKNVVDGVQMKKWCRRTGVSAEAAIKAAPYLKFSRKSILYSVILDEKYRGYIDRSLRRFESENSLDRISLSEIGSYLDINEICWEAREALERERPGTLASARQIPGVRPTDVQGLLIYLGRKRSTWNTPSEKESL